MQFLSRGPLTRPRTMPDERQAPQNAPERPLADFPLTVAERRILCGALEFTIMLAEGTGRPTATHKALQARLAETTAEPDLTKPQQLAVCGLEAKYGRYHVRHQADRSVVVTGILDDIVMETVCVEPDGTERWRRR